MKIFSILAVALALTACDKDEGGPSYTVKLKIGANKVLPVFANELLEGVSVSASKQSSDKAPKDEDTTGTTNAQGIVSLKLGNFPYVVTFTKEGYMSADAVINVPSSDYDLSSYAVITFTNAGPGGNNNDCRDLLHVEENQTGGPGGGFLRIYKSGQTLSDSDTVTVTNVADPAYVSNGDDLATNLTTSGSQFYLDIYKDSTTELDTVGHVNKPIVAGNDSIPYQVALNGVSRTVNVNRCASGKVSTVIF
jgi:hypothetical protein